MELKPCPFCGNDGSPRHISTGWDRGKTVCDACGCHHWDWNTRPIEDEKDRRIAELEASRDKWKNAAEEMASRVIAAEAKLARLSGLWFSPLRNEPPMNRVFNELLSEYREGGE